MAIQILKRDQYGRCVAMAWRKEFFTWNNIPSMLLNQGFATVYTGQGAEYGGYEKHFLALEKAAKKRRIGIWSIPASERETPMEFKKKQREQ